MGRWLVCCRCAVVGLVIGGSVALVSHGVGQPSAFSVTCTPFPYGNVEATVALSNHRGVGSTGLLTSNPAEPCIHVSSIGVTVGPKNNIEFGWDKDGAGVVDCSGSGTDPNPYIFRADMRSGSFRCFQGPDVPSSDIGFHQTFTLNDAGVDDHFVAYFNGEVIGTSLTENFSVGDAVDNGERHSANGSAAADFGGLEYNSGAWHSWTTHQCFLDDDTTYSNNFTTPEHDVISTTDGGDTC